MFIASLHDKKRAKVYEPCVISGFPVLGTAIDMDNGKVKFFIQLCFIITACLEGSQVNLCCHGSTNHKVFVALRSLCTIIRDKKVFISCAIISKYLDQF